MGPENQQLRVVSRRVEFPITPRRQPAIRAPIPFWWRAIWRRWTRQTPHFNSTLFWSFLLLGLGLVGAIFVQVRVGLLPLRRVSEALARIRDGKARRLEGKFPAEIAPLAAELNSLIEHSDEVVGRARTHVSNLAHFLKTPLTRAGQRGGEREPRPAGRAGAPQVDTMRRQVDHYLARARAAGSVNVLGNRTPVAPVLADLARVLDAHPCRARASPSMRNVRRSLFPRRASGPGRDGGQSDGQCLQMGRRAGCWCGRCAKARRLILTVEDDGPGLSPEERARVGTRGERLDESVPGSGLGLAIVRDISKLYGGFLPWTPPRWGD